ncbi:MAG: superoxide dismutase [Bacteroidota bacterium]
MKNQRRDFLKTAAILSSGSILAANSAGAAVTELAALFPATTAFELPPLGYAFDALEPFIDAQTMQIHHDKHHQAYITKLNELVAKEPVLQALSLEQLLKNVSDYPSPIQTPLRNHGGGHWNHSFFWTILKKDTKPTLKLERVFNESFGSMEQFRLDFEKAALSVFGSGWAWVIKDGSKLVITTTTNQDNPLMDTSTKQGSPILGLDVWEHAYYLKYQNKRADYLKAFWNVLNWNRVEELYAAK